MAINIEDFEMSVTALLGTNTSSIPSEIINSPVYAGVAVSELEKLYPGISTLPETDDRKTDADIAIIVNTALKLMPYWVLNYAKVEQLPGSKVEMFEPDWDALEEQLQARLENALNSIDPDISPVGSGFIGFRTTTGGRSWREGFR